MSHAAHHPKHDRLICSDADPFNAEPGGSNGCARCTALKLDTGNAAITKLAEIRKVAAWSNCALGLEIINIIDKDTAP